MVVLRIDLGAIACWSEAKERVAFGAGYTTYRWISEHSNRMVRHAQRSGNNDLDYGHSGLGEQLNSQ
jgi:hypothetical protein